MGILFVSTNDWVPWGGSEVLWSKTALSILSLKNIVVGVYVREWKPAPPHICDLESAGAKIIYKTREFSFPKKILNKVLPTQFKFSYDDSGVVNRSKWDLVVISLGNHNASLSIAEECIVCKIPYILIVQLVQSATVPYDGTLAQRIKRNYTSAKKVYFVSNDNRKIVESQLATVLENAEVVSNPFPSHGVNTIKYPATENRFSLAFVATLNSNHKGHDLLFEVLSKEKWRSRELYINLYGKGPHEQYLKDLKRFYDLFRVNICDFSSSLEKIWEENQGLILCSRMEGQSLALLEAMSYSRMAIVTDVGDAHALIEDGINGFIATAPTATHVDEALERAWIRREEWETIGKQAGIKLKQVKPYDPVETFVKKILESLKE